MRTEFYLECRDGRKSFYKKAIVLETENYKLLYSYHTPVCLITLNGSVHRLWDSYSATTMRHVNSFLIHYGKPFTGKKWWDSLPVEDLTQFERTVA